jgi:hypothetical protein
LSPGAKREGVALVALDVAWRIEVVVVARRDDLAGQQVSNVETDDVSSIIVCCGGFDALRESWDKTKVSSACKPHGAVECPDCNAAPEEAVEFSFEDFEVAASC